MVEDSVNSGKSLSMCKAQIATMDYQSEILYFAAYVIPGKEGDVDIYLGTLESPRVFEWNIYHQNIMGSTCMDIDGVLCDDPTAVENDDGINYSSFLANARPKIIPSKCVKYLVTSRLEKYRTETERWLDKHSVKYERLIMLDATAEERRALGLHAKFKAEFYKSTDCRLFVESSIVQAEYIYNATGKPVYCIENNQLYDGNVQYKLRYEMPRNWKRTIRKALKKSNLLVKVYHIVRKNN